MSAALVLLPAMHPMDSTKSGNVIPRLWATASLAEAAGALADVHQRKGPQSLRLVQAQSAEPMSQTPQTHVRVIPELAFYRKYTEAMLRRYATMSMEAGRVPSLLGQEMFRGNVTSCKVTGFDDVVIFVEDVAKCLTQLDPGQRHLVRRISLEGYTQGETAAMLGIPMRTVVRRYADATDRLTRLFLERKLLKPKVDVRHDC
jgi:hypothetical protein